MRLDAGQRRGGLRTSRRRLWASTPMRWRGASDRLALAEMAKAARGRLAVRGPGPVGIHPRQLRRLRLPVHGGDRLLDRCPPGGGAPSGVGALGPRGRGTAEVRRERQVPVLSAFPLPEDLLQKIGGELRDRVEQDLLADGVPDGRWQIDLEADIRYRRAAFGPVHRLRRSRRRGGFPPGFEEIRPTLRAGIDGTGRGARAGGACGPSAPVGCWASERCRRPRRDGRRPGPGAGRAASCSTAPASHWRSPPMTTLGSLPPGRPCRGRCSWIARTRPYGSHKEQPCRRCPTARWKSRCHDDDRTTTARPRPDHGRDLPDAPRGHRRGGGRGHREHGHQSDRHRDQGLVGLDLRRRRARSFAGRAPYPATSARPCTPSAARSARHGGIHRRRRRLHRQRPAQRRWYAPPGRHGAAAGVLRRRPLCLGGHLRPHARHGWHGPGLVGHRRPRSATRRPCDSPPSACSGPGWSARTCGRSSAPTYGPSTSSRWTCAVWSSAATSREEKLRELLQEIGLDVVPRLGAHAGHHDRCRVPSPAVSLWSRGPTPATAFAEVGDELYRLPCTLEIGDGSLIFDLPGLRRRSRTSSTRSRTSCGRSLAPTLLGLLAPDLPLTQSIYEAIEMLTTPGTMLDSGPPAPIGAAHMDCTSRSNSAAVYCIQLAVAASPQATPAADRAALRRPGHHPMVVCERDGSPHPVHAAGRGGRRQPRRGRPGRARHGP